MVETYAARQADYEQWDLDALKLEASRVFAIDASTGTEVWHRDLGGPVNATVAIDGNTVIVPVAKPGAPKLVALSLGPSKAIVVGITYLVITNIVLQFLFPRILGAAVRLPALLIIVAFIAGFSLAGILGMFIAIPVAATIAILFDHVYLRIYGTEP